MANFHEPTEPQQLERIGFSISHRTGRVCCRLASMNTICDILSSNWSQQQMGGWVEMEVQGS